MDQVNHADSRAASDFFNTLLGDGPNGEPSVRHWHPETGHLIKVERRDRSSALGCEHSPSVAEFDELTGEATLERWLCMGLLSRPRARNGKERPAYWAKDLTTGVVFIEEYWIDGLLDRRSGPAVIHRDRHTGEILRQERHVGGDLISVDIPNGAKTLYPHGGPLTLER